MDMKEVTALVDGGIAQVAQVGDLIRLQAQANGTYKFSQVPDVQGALVSLDPDNGAIRALVGGFAFEQSNYNRATQAKRQPGSSFKPFIYSAALDNGYTAATLVNDAPIVFVDEYLDKVWRPKNDTNTFLGPIPLREALYKSRNLVSIRTLQSLGVDRTIDYISKFGFNKQDLPRNLSLALGTATLTPMEIATGWSTFANGGYKIAPYLIDKIESRNSETLFVANPPSVPKDASKDVPKEAAALTIDTINAAPGLPTVETQAVAERIVDGRTTYILTSMLQDVIKLGTGRRALALGRARAVPGGIARAGAVGAGALAGCGAGARHGRHAAADGAAGQRVVGLGPAGADGPIPFPLIARIPPAPVRRNNCVKWSCRWRHRLFWREFARR